MELIPSEDNDISRQGIENENVANQYEENNPQGIENENAILLAPDQPAQIEVDIHQISSDDSRKMF